VPADAPGSTAIVVLTPEAEPLAGDYYREHSNAGRDGMTPHVTLLVPFVPAAGMDEDVSHRLDRLFAGFQAFVYHLPRLEYFESGVLYLAPEPPRPFVDLVLALTEEFPDYPPYEGIHEDVVPHITIAQSDDPDLIGESGQRLSRRYRSNAALRQPRSLNEVRISAGDLKRRTRSAR
jgi:2'-5' RNA ligase